jgi:hypothetical protein
VCNYLNNKHQDSAALYWQKNNSTPAFIEIAIFMVFHNKPMLLMFLPFVGKFLIASALYHEIGHHHHYSLTHGVRKKKIEIFAEQYKKKMLKKAFWVWRIILLPFAPFARYMANRNYVK